MNATTEYYGKQNLSDVVIEMYFNGLLEYSFDHVKHAISRHMRDANSGQWLPKVADLIRHIEGGQVTHDQVLGAARLATSPLGILCRIQIGTFDLEHQTDMFYLKQRAEECLALLDEWKARAIEGDYTDHEISIMVKHGVDPCEGFYPGLPSPKNKSALFHRVEGVKSTPRHRFLLEKTEKPSDEPLVMSQEVRQFLTKD
jgi:hypothetical protein